VNVDELPKQIELLVDNLRKSGDEARSLTDVAMVTEVLISTMQAFFKSVDTAVYKECRELSEYIHNARKEIASISPAEAEDDGDTSDRLPRAGMELDAIVQATEDATNTIMEAAEEIMGADPSDMDAYQNLTNDAVMRIFEACSFQDITGQRVSKVVHTLHHIEARVEELSTLLGVSEKDILESKKAEQEGKTAEDALLQGPALAGEGIDQSSVDALLGDDFATPAAAATEPEATPRAPEPEPEPEPAPEPKVEAPKAVSPKELDAMFEEDFDPVADLAAEETDEEPAPEPVAAEPEKKKDEKEEEINMPAGEEVSQDDIDALFG
jgi:chemotaxis regulatin CheY-phosphate phosphatase CheZ